MFHLIATSETFCIATELLAALICPMRRVLVCLAIVVPATVLSSRRLRVGKATPPPLQGVFLSCTFLSKHGMQATGSSFLGQISCLPPPHVLHTCSDLVFCHVPEIEALMYGTARSVGSPALCVRRTLIRVSPSQAFVYVSTTQCTIPCSLRPVLKGSFNLVRSTHCKFWAMIASLTSSSLREESTPITISRGFRLRGSSTLYPRRCG